MAEIRPIKALRFTEKAGDIASLVCPPYDIISPSEREKLIASNGCNIIRLELPQGSDGYEKAGETLRAWLSDGILARDGEEGIFVYREEFSVGASSYVLTGIICLVKLYEFSERVILPHEETLTKAKKDRFELMSATDCNFSSVYSLYNDEEGFVPSVLASETVKKPLCRFTDPEGVTHSLWKISDPERLGKICGFFVGKQLFIADGHHRYETALNYKKKLCSDGRLNDTDGDCMMMTLVATDDPGLVVFPTHRLIVDMPVNRDELISRCSHDFDISVLPISVLDRELENGRDCHTFAMYDGKDDFLLFRGKAHIGKERIEGRSSAYGDLDVSILHHYILQNALGIDRENMANQVNLRYTRSEEEAKKAVDEGIASAAFIINATKVSQIKAVSLAGDKMPQKSTYFYPKLKTGLVMNRLTREGTEAK